MRKNNLAILVFVFFFLMMSCKKESFKREVEQYGLITSSHIVLNENYVHSGKLEKNPKERIRNALIELTEISKKIFANSNVRAEIYYLSQSEFYKDYYVPLKDLANYKYSALYSSVDIPENLKGSFFKAIEKIINPEEYPNLYYIWSYLPKNQQILQRIEPCDTLTNDEYYEMAGLTYYIPYAPDYDLDNFNPSIVPVSFG